MSLKMLQRVTTFAIPLAICVVMLGAYTRLTDAGLGCPDWPGCYGHMVLPSLQSKMADIAQQFPGAPIESHKAWTEMVHRYAAGTLALLIFFIGFSALRYRFKHPSEKRLFKLPLILVGLVVFQALLGMWTVTLKLLPIVVMGHLLGGVLIFASLYYFRMQLSSVVGEDMPRWHNLINIGIFLVFFQIVLGAWVSSNYAGIACIGFPKCNGQWIPPLHFSPELYLFSSNGMSYQGGILDNDARVTIQFIHRIGAMVVFCYVTLLSLFILFFSKKKQMQINAMIALFLVMMQFALGIANVVYLLPLWVAVMHNGMAALLLTSMLGFYYLSHGGGVNARRS